MYDEDRRLSELRTATKDGFAEGIKEGKVESARNLKALGVSDEIISQATGLPLEVVKSL